MLTFLPLISFASFADSQELNELKDQIQDVEGKYMQGLKEMKVPVHGGVGCCC